MQGPGPDHSKVGRTHAAIPAWTCTHAAAALGLGGNRTAMVTSAAVHRGMHAAPSQARCMCMPCKDWRVPLCMFTRWHATACADQAHALEECVCMHNVRHRAQLCSCMLCACSPQVCAGACAPQPWEPHPHGGCGCNLQVPSFLQCRTR